MTQGATGLNTQRLVLLHASGSGQPLFIFPGIHGTPETYADLAARLGDKRPVYGFKHIGVQEECEPVRVMERLAQLYAVEVRSVQPRGPYFLFGYSFGGVVAFEVARELRAQAERVALVIMADCPAPGYPKPPPLFTRARAHVQNLLARSNAQRIAYLRERAQNGAQRLSKLAGFTPQGDPKQPAPEHVQRVDAALYEAYDHYRLTPLNVDVLFLTADSPPDWPTIVFDDPLMGWGPALRGRISQCGIPGAHLSIFAPENVPVLAERMRTGIAQAELNERADASGLVATVRAS
jgi:thioesterase domain-containing protein